MKPVPRITETQLKQNVWRAIICLDRTVVRAFGESEDEAAFRAERLAFAVYQRLYPQPITPENETCPL